MQILLEYWSLPPCHFAAILVKALHCDNSKSLLYHLKILKFSARYTSASGD